MDELLEARKQLVQALGDDLSKKYWAVLRAWIKFWRPLSKLQFYSTVQKLFTNKEQERCHDNYIQLFFANASEVQHVRTTDKGGFVLADYKDYMPELSSVNMPASIVNRTAAAEYFLPDSNFMTSRIEIHAWENSLDGAEDGVADFMVLACQMFVKNILTAMISKKESYKIRDGNFQYAFGFPVPDPLLRNTRNIIDHTQESKIEVMEEDDSFIPSYCPTLETVEQRAAFAYSCGKRNYSDDKLTVKLLYETLKENPAVIGLHSIQSVNLLKIGLQFEEP